MLDQLARTLLIWITLAVLAHSAGPASQQATVECPTCDGTGHALQRCSYCSGDGKRICVRCNPPDGALWPLDLAGDIESLRAVDLSKLPEKASQRDKLVERWEARARERAEMDALLEKTRKFLEEMDMLHPSRSSPGSAPCPARCKDGKKGLKGEDTCAYCKGRGSMKCVDCEPAGWIACNHCKRKGELQQVCESCVGVGRIPDPALRPVGDVDACPLCLGVVLAACTQCQEEGVLETWCWHCNAEGELTCAQCVGTGMKPCTTCSGRGKTASGGCDSCKKRGKTACDKCSDGKITCANCKGLRSSRGDCWRCDGLRFRACNGCLNTQFLGWEVAGERLLKSEDRERAAPFFAKALQRAEAHHERLRPLATANISASEKSKRERFLAKARESDTQRLKKRIAECREKRSAPAGG
ncbi:MAG: hypothetical protein JNN27_21910 [Planctomycetes bacterium]|nr:hypothetical protein [Planctomycetota bacterium]